MLIEPTVDPSVRKIRVEKGDTIQARGLGASDVIAIEIPDGAGGWTQLVEDYDNVQLDSNNLQITARGASVIRINKPSTGTAVGVALIAK